MSIRHPSRNGLSMSAGGRLAGFAVLALGAFLNARPAAAAPDAALLAAAGSAQAAVVDTLKTLVQIETGSRDVEGLRSLAGVVEARLMTLGFATERRKAAAGPGADTVLGTFRGNGKRRFMLQAHMDTVYQRGILQGQPIRLDGNRLYGPGIADDKGGIAVILHGLNLLLDTGGNDFATISVLFNPDGETGSPGSGELIATLAADHDTVLSYEPTGAKAANKAESLLLGAAGTAAVVMEVKGRAAHAGVAPGAGRNAIIEISHQMLQTRDIAKDIPGAQLNGTNVISNKATNQIPELATARADVRMTQPGAEQRLLTALQARVAPPGPQFDGVPLQQAAIADSRTRSWRPSD